MGATNAEAVSVVLVVPCYNEAERLDTEQFVAWSKEHPRVSFVFVDDGSEDNTREVLEQLVARRPKRFHAHALTENQGKAEAVRQGVLHALDVCDAEYFGYWDADLATPLDELPRFIDALDSHDDIDMILGSRVKLLGRHIDRQPMRHYLGRIFATAASLTLRLRVYDTQCGAKLFRRREATVAPFREPFTTRWVFDVQMLQRYLQRAPKDRIIEIPLMKWVDVAGSKVKPTDFFVAFFDLLRIAAEGRHNPGSPD
jgi:glycosyltransferase involved in cell wall biosynthesis